MKPGLRYAAIISFAIGAALPLIVSATPRTTIDNDDMAYYETPVGGYGVLGADVSTPYSANVFASMDPNAIKLYHGLFDFDGPPDEHAGTFFPLEELQAYNNDEVAAGRNPLLVTATYNGQKYPLIWVVDGNNFDIGKQLFNIGDPRYVRFFADEYARKVLDDPEYPQNANSPDFPTSGFSTDEASFEYGNFAIDVNGSEVFPSAWDQPFPQNNQQYVEGIESFLTQLKQIAPDVKFFANVGSINDESVTDGSPTNFAAVFGKMDGIDREALVDITNDDYNRGSVDTIFNTVSWFENQPGKIAILREPVDGSAGQEETGAVAYEIVKDGNSFFDETAGSSAQLNPTVYTPMFNVLGNPTAEYQEYQDPSCFGVNDPDHFGHFYWRTYEGGIVYLNWTGCPETVTLPTSTAYYDQNGNPVTSLTIPDITGTYVTTQAGVRAAEPTLYPPITPGAITGPVAVSISDATPGAQIYYTTDGSIPTASSTLYIGPVSLSSSATITAKAFASGYLDSFEKAATYTITSANPIANFVLSVDSSTVLFPETWAAITLDHASDQSVTINYNITGQSGVTFSPSSGSVIFQPLETAKAFAIQASIPAGSTQQKSLTVTLTQATNATLGSNTTYTYTIVPDSVSSETYFVNLHPSANAEIQLTHLTSPVSTVNYLETGNYGNGNLARSLWKFDLSSIPSNATIQSAVIEGYTPYEDDTTGSGIPTSAYRMLSNWTQSGATWSNSGGVASNTALTPSATNQAVYYGNIDPPTSPSYLTDGQWNVTTDVQAMVQGTEPNYGWVMVGPESGSNAEYFRWYDDSYVDSGGKALSGPQTSLLVTYTVPTQGSAPLPDTTPPVTSITSPINNAVVSSTIVVAAAASDNVGVTQVQLYVDGILSGTDTTSPYTFSVNTTALSNGAHTLQTKAYDAAGNIGVSLAVTVTANNQTADATPPSIPTNLAAPTVTTSTVGLSWTSSTDNVGVAGYKIYRGGVQVGTSTTTSFMNSGLTANTTYSYTVSAYDAAGNNSAQSTPLSITTSLVPDTAPPTASLISPANNATVSGTISVSATAVDNVGVVKVEFYLDGVLQQTDTASPYTWSWNTNSAANGTHTLFVKAYDAAGNIGSSAIVMVTVSNIAQTLTASLAISNESGTVPLTVSFTADAGGTAQGTLNYIFYCNRSDAGTNVTSPADLTVSASNQNPYVASDICSYQTAGVYTAKVIIQRGTAASAEAQQVITVSAPSGGTPTSTPPLISSVTVGQITDTSAQLTITTTQAASIVVKYGSSTSYGAATLASPNLTTIFENLVNLTQSTTYDFDVVAIAQGTTIAVPSQNFSFTTQTTPTSGGGGGGSSSGGGGGNSGGGSTGGGSTGGSSSGGGGSFGGGGGGGGGTPSPGTTSSGSTGNSSPGLPTSTIFFPRALSFGDTGPDVALLQRLLKNLGFFNATTTITDYFGTFTQHAVILFQNAHDLNKSGFLDTPTAELLNKVVSADPLLVGAAPSIAPTIGATGLGVPSVQFSRNLGPGSSGQDVLSLQKILFSDGDYPIDLITGYYGNLTEQAVKVFQAKYGIISYGSPNTTGYGAVGPRTRKELQVIAGAA